MEEIKNAKITSTALGYEDHGILTFYIYVDCGGSGQGFGGYALDKWSEDDNDRVPTEHAGQAIKNILGVVGVDKWEDLAGKNIRVKGGFNGISEIGNLLEDRWFNPESELK